MQEKTPPVVIDTSGADIHAENARIRERGPVAEVELPNGVRAWSITGYEAGKQALSDQRMSKDGRQHWTAFTDGEVDPTFPLIDWALMDNMNTTYGSAHSRMRALVAKRFTPRRVEAMRPTIDKIVSSLLADLAASPAGTVVDLKARYAYPLAAHVIFDVLGIAGAARDTILGDGEAQVDTTKTGEEIAASVEQGLMEMAALVEAKRGNRADDLMSDLITAQEADGSGLRDAEIVGTLSFLLGTGTETVTNLVINSIHALLTHPDQRRLISSGQASCQDAIEETFRVEAPVAHLPFRFPTEDVQLGEVTIRAGDPVLMNFAAIGRDPAVHGESADSFDITRSRKDHLSFGHGGYSCIGKALGRLEAEIAVPALFARFPDLALAVPASEIAPQSGFIMNGRSELPVLLSAPLAESA
ncbi:cytochrome P450 [Micromonospora terminaliae]|uniref:Cytochrome P450 n=1 Tax=Micromonospora terminaliae TaxID=1914461 RepID=A0AAJ3DKT8_9ACTN|nr:cytochrome P450 [Micromonospora terminaliae]NES30214.1 cytochrome P450 [Micromonospora terminaliae]QGL47015.1 cytochrome P450 [Micromonospora terminaliae]